MLQHAMQHLQHIGSSTEWQLYDLFQEEKHEKIMPNHLLNVVCLTMYLSRRKLVSFSTAIMTIAQSNWHSCGEEHLESAFSLQVLIKACQSESLVRSKLVNYGTKIGLLKSESGIVVHEVSRRSIVLLKLQTVAECDGFSTTIVTTWMTEQHRSIAAN